MTTDVQYEKVIRGALVFDGSGAEASIQDVAIADGRIAARAPQLPGRGKKEIDASGHWLMPGLLDIHTHLDLEVELNPGLDEVVRHGTTSVLVGNCSLGVSFGPQTRNGENPVVDCFARVENVPKPVLQKCVDALHWSDTGAYLDHFNDIALGPNIAALVPHSMLRIEVMGVEDSLRRQPTNDESRRMHELLAAALEQGFVGFSTDGLPFHYLANEPHKDMRIPTQYADFRELKSLLNVVRARDRVWQATPDSHDRLKTLRWFALTSGRLYGKPLRTSALTAIDPVADPKVWKAFLGLAKLLNSRLLKGRFHFQVLSTPFRLYGDGVTNPAFEELPATAELISKELEDRAGRLALLNDPEFIERFRSDWASDAASLSLKREFSAIFVENCPIESWKGKSFQALMERAQSFQAGNLSEDSLEPGEVEFFDDCPVDLTLDSDFMMALLRAFDRDLRWWTVAANNRPEVLRQLLFDENTLPGFNDSGAHLTNLAFFDANLCTLQMAQRESAAQVSRAVNRLTRAPAEFFNLDVGRIDEGCQADITVIDPKALAGYNTDASREEIYRDIFEAKQLVNRSDGIVHSVYIAGETVWENGASTSTLGSKRLGRCLRAG